MKYELLDHGYLNFIEHWGSDERIVEAARMSTDGAFKGWGPIHAQSCPQNTYNMIFDPIEYDDCNCTPKPGDEKLLAYLYNNKHTSPFEMAGIVIEVQAPIFVFRQWQRSRTASYNEMSGRYTELLNLDYIPSLDRLMTASDGKNKQAGTIKGAKALDLTSAEFFRIDLKDEYERCQLLYEAYLLLGIPKELARIILPQARYSRMRVSANLHNWLHFLTLRMADDAQFEIREYANALSKIVAKLFPRTYNLFNHEN